MASMKKPPHPVSLEKGELFTLVRSPDSSGNQNQRGPEMSYQSIAGQQGASKSDAKLQAIMLPDNLKGKRVLDLGCNEGFFCQAAKKRGAEQVVGMDMDEGFLSRAKEHARSQGLDIDFRQGSMMNLPEEQFDYVLLLSALHYIDNPAELMRRIKGVLAPGGKLVLECGVSPKPGMTVDLALRSVDRRYFPTRDLLIDVWLQDYSVKSIGGSIQQVGDPIPRYVFHCTPAVTNVLFIEGNGGIGKTTLSRKIGPAPVISTDDLFVPSKDKDAPAPEAQARYDEHLRQSKSIWGTWDALKHDEAITSYFVSTIVDAIKHCRGSASIIVEGFVVSTLREPVERALGNTFRCWTINRSSSEEENLPWQAYKR